MAGHVRGEWETLWRTVAQLHREKKLDLVLVIEGGKVESEVPDGPVPAVVFAQGQSGKRGNIDFQSSNGVLSVSAGPQSLQVAHFTSESEPLDISEVPDILITDSWPLGFHHHLSTPPQIPGTDFLSEVTAALALKLSPRYHFAAKAEQYYERPPYLSPMGWPTRFIGLGKVTVSAAALETFVFLLEIDSMEAIPRMKLLEQPSDITDCPFQAVQQPVSELLLTHLPKGISEAKLASFLSGFGEVKDIEIVRGRHASARVTVLAMDADAIVARTHGSLMDGKSISVEKKGAKIVKKPSTAVKEPVQMCWFCLANPATEESLIVDVLDHWYIAVPKGPISDQHMLLVPILHLSSRTDLPSHTRAELDTLIGILKARFDGFLLFENSRKSAPGVTYHFYINVLPLEEAWKGLLETRMQRDLALSPYSFNFLPSTSLLPCVPETISNFTLLSLYSRTAAFHQVYDLSEDPDPADIGRKAACSLISKSDLADWRSIHDAEREVRMAGDLRKIMAST